MSSAPNVIVIGAGVAGMTAALHLRSSGFEVDLFERHDIAGGLCTSWKLGGFLFDGCVEFFVGSGPKSPFYELWREVGVVPRPFLDRSIYSETTFEGGGTVRLYADPDRLQAHFDELSPKDQPRTKTLCDLVRLMRTARYRVDRAPELMSFLEKARQVFDAMASMRVWREGFATTLRDFATQFEDHRLRAAVLAALPAEVPLLSLVQVLGDLANGAAGCPVGGSIQVAQSMAKRAKALGVRFHFGAEVERVIVEAGAARGVVVKGVRHEASAVVAALDLRTTLDHLLEGRFPSPVHEAAFERQRVPPVCIVSVGVSEPIEAASDTVVRRHVFEAPFVLGGKTVSTIGWKSYAHDPSVAAPPKTVVELYVETDAAHWFTLAKDRAAYDAARKRFGAAVVAAMERAVPGFQKRVLLVDVATPVTVERYTKNHQGHFMTFLSPPGRPPVALPRTVPGLRGLWLAGMWVEPPGGLPNALRSGRHAAEVICHQRGVPFRPCPPAMTSA